MVSAAAAALVVVLLQLHASDTLKDINETAAAARPQTSAISRPPPLGATSTPARIHRSERAISRQDEDLLDLMVRIAETPEEWERIHRVLSLIGQEKAYDTTEHYENMDYDSVVTAKSIFSEININPSQHNFELNQTNLDNPLSVTTINISIPTTETPPTTTLKLATETEVNDSEHDSFEDDDEGWPDFEEAIVKKVKKFNAFDESDILETNWLGNDWLDPSWNKFINDEKSTQSSSDTSESVPSERYKTVVGNEKNSIDKGDDVPRSRLYRDPKILEFRLKNEHIPIENQTVEHNTSEGTNGSAGHGDRPVFVYHRVTTSPHERRGNSAFIAVSVVRQGPGETSTTAPPRPRPLWDHLLRIQKTVKDSSSPKHQKKHPHWRQDVHWKHNRGRRHHHADH